MKNSDEIADYAALPHILVVDDDDRIRELVTRYLKDNGFFVSAAEDAAEAKSILKIASYDALVVDVMMPGQDGMEFTQEIRETNDALSDVPILLLTAMGEVDDKITGLTAGADDYLTKPFDPRELILRLQAILRRRPQHKTEIKKLRIGEWIYDADQKTIQEGDTYVRLTDGEANLLGALATKTGEAISREELAEQCGLDPDKRTVDVQVTRLRRKLGDDSSMPKYLQTVRGKGYLLRAERL
jgi:two-component system phosphate regulon response regulator OmpR